MPSAPGDAKAKYALGKVLGKGNFGTVKEGTDKATGNKVAVKIVDKTDLSFDAESLEQEIATLTKVSHPNCVILHEVFDEPQKTYLVMELVSGETVADRIISVSDHFSEKNAAAVAENVLNAVAYLHSIGITHRDIKPQNMLYASSDPQSLYYNTVKVVDFGLAKYHGDATMKTACGSHGYESPELLDPNLPYGEGYTPKVDVWSMGVVLYIMLAGYPPFYAQNMAVQMNQIREGKYEFHSPYWDSISSSAKELVSSMLVVNPKKRASAKQCFEHRWIADAASQTTKQLHGSYRAFLLIRRLSIFDNIPPKVLQDITQKLKTVQVAPGDYVMRAGEEGDCMYFINSGTVAVIVDGQEIDRLKTGQFFGEIALTVSKTRTADVVSLGMQGSFHPRAQSRDAGGPEGVELYQLMRTDLESLYSSYPALRTRIQKIGNNRRRRASVEFGVEGLLIHKSDSMDAIAPPTPGTTFDKLPNGSPSPSPSPGTTPSTSARRLLPAASPAAPNGNGVVHIDLDAPAEPTPMFEAPKERFPDLSDLRTIREPLDQPPPPAPAAPPHPSPPARPAPQEPAEPTPMFQSPADRFSDLSDLRTIQTPIEQPKLVTPSPSNAKGNVKPFSATPKPAQTPSQTPPRPSNFVREGAAPQAPLEALYDTPPVLLPGGGSFLVGLQGDSFVGNTGFVAMGSVGSMGSGMVGVGGHPVGLQGLQMESFSGSQQRLPPFGGSFLSNRGSPPNSLVGSVTLPNPNGLVGSVTLANPSYRAGAASPGPATIAIPNPLSPTSRTASSGSSGHPAQPLHYHAPAFLAHPSLPTPGSGFFAPPPSPPLPQAAGGPWLRPLSSGKSLLSPTTSARSPPPAAAVPPNSSSFLARSSFPSQQPSFLPPSSMFGPAPQAVMVAPYVGVQRA